MYQDNEFQSIDCSSYEAAIRKGAAAALVYSILRSIGALLLDPGYVIEAGAALVLAMFMLRKSRVAASMMFLLFLVHTLTSAARGGLRNSVQQYLAFLMFSYLFRAVGATFHWHNERPDSSPVSLSLLENG